MARPTISFPVLKLELSSEEINRLKIDPDSAKAKIQEAKDAALAKHTDKEINASHKENKPPAVLEKKKLQGAKDTVLAKQVEDAAILSPEEHEATTVLSPVIDKQDATLFKWRHEAILLLIEEYKIRADDFTSGRISQKRVWEIISKKLIQNGHDVNGPQCMSKFCDLKKTYKSVKDHNGKSGNGTRVWPYFDLMDSLLGMKPFMAPVTTVSSTGKRSRTESESSNDSHSGDRTPKRSPKGSTKDIISVLQKSKETAEENRDKRDEEKMEQRDRGLALLEKLISSLEK